MSEKWVQLPEQTTFNNAVKNLRANGFNVVVAENGKEALEHLKKMIPRGSEVMVGGSVTLEEIGFSSYLKSGDHGWKDLYAEITSQNDSAKRNELRRKAVTAEYFLAGVNAITTGGALIACDHSGSRIGAYAFAAKNLILVSGAQKITENLNDAFSRVREYAYPLVNQMTKTHYGFACCMSKWLILESEPIKGRTTLILVKEKLGF
jgi:L-lactate utilization protein LutB